jgi:predicted metal-dependent hydrolase
MTTERTLVVRGLPVDVVRRDVKHLHLAVYPPHGSVRLVVPTHVDNDAARLAVASRFGWIRRQQNRYQDQERQSSRKFVSGEAHYVWGRRYRLEVTTKPGAATVTLRNDGRLILTMPRRSTIHDRGEVLAKWYRQQLRAKAGLLVEKWSTSMDAAPNEWRIKRMKTRWGTCSQGAKRIWLNLELAKKSPRCLEFIIVHELVHLRERHHGARFQSLMHEWMPDWRQRREELNQAPLANEHWLY